VKQPHRLIIVSFLLVASFLLVYPLQEKINLGLDLKGGMHLVMKVDTSGLTAKEKRGASERALEIIRNRIDELGVKEPVIQPQGEDELLIQLPGVVDRERALKIIGQTALLEFKLVEDDEKVIEANKKKLDSEHIWAPYQGEKILLKKKALITGADLEDAQVGFGSLGMPYVSLKFNAQGSKKFAKITEENVGRRLAIILDGKVKTAPVIKEPILSGNAQITGNYSLEEANDLSLVLRSGALPCPLRVEEERTVGPLLGEDSIRRGIKATVLGVIAVSTFMVIYYFLAGVVAVLALGFNLLLILAGLSFLHATLTLPGIAGIILTLGMAVDANVLIYERIREELSLGRPLSFALKLGYERAFKTIFDSNVTTLIAALCLFIFGTGPIKGFGITLSLGIVASMFTALVFSRMMLEFIAKKRHSKNLAMMTLLKNPHFDFISKVKFCLFASTIIIAVGIYLFGMRGQSIYGIDFTGGQIQEYKFDKNIDLAKVRKLLLQAGLKDITLYDFKSQKNTLGIKSSEDTFAQVKRVLDSNFAPYHILRMEKVGPVVGRLLKKKAWGAIFFAIIGILFYITLRFKHFDFALSAVVALFHDILIALGFLLFFSHQIDLLIVTALLTIAGYSINDTIVVYDRIREISPRLYKKTLSEVINQAINQTLSRTVITSLTTILVVLCLYFVGSQNLKGFSFALLVGFVSGTYSSIYIASPLVILLRRKGRKK